MEINKMNSTLKNIFLVMVILLIAFMLTVGLLIVGPIMYYIL